MLFHVKGDIRDVLILFALQLVVLSFCIPTADEHTRNHLHTDTDRLCTGVGYESVHRWRQSGSENRCREDCGRRYAAVGHRVGTEHIRQQNQNQMRQCWLGNHDSHFAGGYKQYVGHKFDGNYEGFRHNRPQGFAG